MTGKMRQENKKAKKKENEKDEENMDKEDVDKGTMGRSKMAGGSSNKKLWGRHAGRGGWEKKRDRAGGGGEARPGGSKNSMGARRKRSRPALVLILTLSPTLVLVLALILVETWLFSRQVQSVWRKAIEVFSVHGYFERNTYIYIIYVYS